MPAPVAGSPPSLVRSPFRPMRFRLFAPSLALLIGSPILHSQVVFNSSLYAEMQSGFGADVCGGCRLGSDVATLGDLDGDGVEELAFGAPLDSENGVGTGSVWIAFLNADGTVKSEQKINETNGGFGGSLAGIHFFGSTVAALGDLDGDGVEDLAVGATEDDGGGMNRGAVWILFLNADGTVKSEQKIDEFNGGLTGPLEDDDRFGSALVAVGDLDGDGVTELAVGAIGDDDGFSNAGAVYILFLNSNGTVASEQKISATAGGLAPALTLDDEFGGGLGALGDFDGDGVEDLAVGAIRFANLDGAVFLLNLNADGTVKSQSVITDNMSGLPANTLDSELFGSSIVVGDDFDLDGIPELFVGAPSHRTVDGVLPGAVYILFLDATGTVTSFDLVTDETAAFGKLFGGDAFGCGLSLASDFDGNGKLDVVVGAKGTDIGGLDAGGAWLISMFSGTPDTAEIVERIGAGNLDGAMTVLTTGNFSPPIVGGGPRFTIDTALGTGHDRGLYFAFDSKVDIPIFGGQYTLLCVDSGLGFGELLTGSGRNINGGGNGLARLAVNIPLEGRLIGFEFTVQGAVLDSTAENPIELCNAFDLTVGL